jgi:hypothetical protein
MKRIIPIALAVLISATCLIGSDINNGVQTTPTFDEVLTEDPSAGGKTLEDVGGILFSPGGANMYPASDNALVGLFGGTTNYPAVTLFGSDYALNPGEVWITTYGGAATKIFSDLDLDDNDITGVSSLSNSTPVEVLTTATAGKDIVNYETMEAQGYLTAIPVTNTTTVEWRGATKDLYTTFDNGGSTATMNYRNNGSSENFSQVFWGTNSLAGAPEFQITYVPLSGITFSSILNENEVFALDNTWDSASFGCPLFANSVDTPYLTNSSPVEVHTTATAGKDIVNYETMVAKGYVAPQGSVTFYYDSGTFTDTQFQSDIDSLGKYIPYGNTVRFVFSNGTYTIDQQITLNGFYGGGTLEVEAQNGVTGPTTSQNVIFTLSNTGNFYFRDSRVRFWFQDIECTFNNNSAVLINACSSMWIYDCYFNNSTTDGAAVQIYSTPYCSLARNYFTGSNTAIKSQNMSLVESNENDDTGTQPLYGLGAYSGSTIGKSSTQPTGSTASEYTTSGGEIR